jgi:hypothetical protein
MGEAPFILCEPSRKLQAAPDFQQSWREVMLAPLRFNSSVHPTALSAHLAVTPQQKLPDLCWLNLRVMLGPPLRKKPSLRKKLDCRPRFSFTSQIETD